MTDQLREMLTDAGRVLAMEGHGDYVAGHFSARLPGDSGTLLMKPAAACHHVRKQGRDVTRCSLD
ncbi:MAG: hypothetical protein WB760_25250 [Xanthobacteraceae bacterium]